MSGTRLCRGEYNKKYMNMENYDEEYIDRIIANSDDETLENIYTKLLKKLQRIETKIYDINDRDKKIEYIRNNTNGLNGINLDDVKQIETDYYNNVYVLLYNGKLYENGKLKNYNIDELYMFDGLTLFKISNNKIFPIIDDKNDWTNIDWYFYNNGCSYKKIIKDILYFVALAEDGRVFAMSSNPTGIAVNSENFINVDDIFLKKVDDDLYEPYIMKGEEEKPLYVMR